MYLLYRKLILSKLRDVFGFVIVLTSISSIGANIPKFTPSQEFVLILYVFYHDFLHCFSCITHHMVLAKISKFLSLFP